MSGPRITIPPMPITDPSVRAIFQPDETKPIKALLVAGACGNVGFGKLGQFARLLVKHGVPVVALDLSDKVHGVKQQLREAFGKRFDAAAVDEVLDNITIVQGTLADVPAGLRLGFVFEAIPERLDLKQPFYRAIRERDSGAYLFSATSGLTTKHLFEGLPGADRSGVMHPFFPHLTNKLWEVPTRGCTTSAETLGVIRKFLGGLGMNLLETSDVPAFAADRIFCGMMLEAVRICESCGLSTAVIDDACRKLLGTSPFYVHNLIPGANYLSAHCMQLLGEEVDSTLYQIPEIWRPYMQDPRKQWPYERGATATPEQAAIVEQRMLGMLFSLTSYMLKHEVAGADALNFLCENALAFRIGTPALMAERGLAASKRLVDAFVQEQAITQAERVAPIAELDETALREIYVGTSVHGNVGLISLKRLTLNHQFIAELDRAYESLAGNDAVHSIVVAPDGTLSREFGHGADPACFVPVLGKYEASLGLIQTWKRTLSKFHTSAKPTVAAMVGRVLGGSNELASCCHARIAGAGTMIGQPEPTVGVLPALGGCNQLLRASSPEATTRINELLLTGHAFRAEEAAEWGYVSKVVAIRDLPRESMKMASALASGELARPSFRMDGARIVVDRDVNPRNEAGVPLDAELRELIAKTIEEANALPFAEGALLEQQRGAESLTMSSSKLGVAAMLRGKPPQFEKPLA
jgi:enoyl-CoA hydratase/carnithine racemase/3-hydroxyacyl-CoA dehydrogenase